MVERFSSLADAAAWFQAWFAEAALPLWADVGVDGAHGLFQEGLDVDGRPVAGPRRARAQARQVFVFATAASSGYGERWLPTAREGYGRFVQHYRRPDGLFLRLAGPDGTPLETDADIYDQAFAMLAVAALHTADPAGGFAAEADRTLAALQARRAPAGGFQESPPHPFQANCHMHLFECALAWEEVGGGPEWTGLADEIAGMALARFIDADTGALREFFDPQWRAITGEAGLVEPGHQFEWAWLLERWGRARQEPAALAAARRLYANGLKGVDAERQVAVNALWDDFSVRDADARLWPQTEHLKAALVLGSEAEALRAARGLAQYLETPARGAWRDKLRADGSFVDEPAPATSFYHLAVAILELRAHTAG
ncbi:MAG: AGE family epimerase/isomerase [Phenylobacterium sp.]